jgi:hypothetical protein
MSKALVTSRKYENFFLPEQTSYLTGNVGDVIDLTLQLDVEISSLSSFSNPNMVTNGDRITRQTGSWYDDGFVENQTIQLTYDLTIDPAPTGTVTFDATIKTLTPTIMICENILEVGGGGATSLPNVTFPYTDGTTTLSGLSIISTASVEGLEMEYGLVTNTQTQAGTTTSLIDGSTTSFVHPSIDASSGTVLTLNSTGYKSGASILSSTIKGLGINGSIQSFEINIKYILTPLFESITDLQTPVTLPSFYDNTECIGDSFKIKFLPQSGNPNASVSTASTETKLLGNTGFFEENYNGQINNFSIDSYSLFVNGLPVTGIQTSGVTSFTIVLNDPNGTAASRYKMAFAWTPDDEALYSDNGYYNHENLLYNGLNDNSPLSFATGSGLYNGYSNASGAIMDIELTSVTNAGGLTTFKGKFRPNATFTTYMDSQQTGDKKYLIWLSAADPSLSASLSDRVSLVVDSSSFTEEAVSYQSWDVSNSFLEHPEPAQQVGVSFYSGCSEDEILARSVIKLDTSKNETVEEVTFEIQGYNSVTQQSYILESNSYDTSIFVKDSAGIQQIALDKTRGFLMAAGVDKNFVKVERSPIDDLGTIVGYKALYAFRGRWEDWIANSNVPSQFYDNLELNNNLNDDWASKDNLADWSLTFALKMKVNSLGTIIDTQNRFSFELATYEESTIWDGEITNFNEAKTSSLYLGLNADGIRQNVILPNENTFVQADFDLEDLLGDVGSASDYYGVIRIEEYRNGGLFKIHMLSSYLDNITSGNILIPLTGETKTKVSKISLTKMRLECFIDKNEIDTSVAQYKISARLGDLNINIGKYSKQYSLKYN